jgi:hypothetical protein
VDADAALAAATWYGGDAAADAGHAARRGRRPAGAAPAAEASRYWALAAKAGHPEAQWKLGFGYYKVRAGRVRCSPCCTHLLIGRARLRPPRALLRLCPGPEHCAAVPMPAGPHGTAARLRGGLDVAVPLRQAAGGCGACQRSGRPCHWTAFGQRQAPGSRGPSPTPNRPPATGAVER